MDKLIIKFKTTKKNKKKSYAYKQLKRISNKLNYRLEDKLQLIQIVFQY
jgi:hypothetical protein